MWLIVSCVAQSKARVHTGESGGSYWTCLILPSSPQLLITFTLMMFQCQFITPPDVSILLFFLFPCWLGVIWYEQLPVMVTVALWIHPTITACLLSACEMTTHSWSHTLCSPCKAMLELQLFRSEIKDFITGVITMWDLCKTLNKAIQNAESLCGVNNCMASFQQLSLVCSTILSQ